MASTKPSGPVTRKVPEGDTRERLVCDDCGFVLYSNPKVMVGSVATWQGRILLCRRDIEPRTGYWTLPAGYLENGETTADGARREAREEACADLELDHVLAVYSIPRISQVQVIYAARLASPDVAAGEETTEVGFFAWDEIPWDDLAFPSVRWALHHWREAQQTGDTAARSNPPGETGNYLTGQKA
jgi:ADP-ribose pyrophosphatase YjhB (NUDIX family)